MKALVIGGGIGGFSAALACTDKGIEVEVFEQADGIRELGVGINLLPHAVKRGWSGCAERRNRARCSNDGVSAGVRTRTDSRATA